MNSVQAFMNFRRMRHIKRCNTYPTSNPTDVAQHSYFVTMLAMLFADEYESNRMKLEKPDCWVTIDTEKLLRKAMLHDIEEVFISDIPYTVKHASDSLHNELEKVTNATMTDVMESAVMRRWEAYREYCKTGVEGSIVAFCDMLELAIYSYEEMITGNSYMSELLNNCNDYLDDLLKNVINSLGYTEDANEGLDLEDVCRKLIPSICELRCSVATDSYNIKGFMYF